MKKCFILLAVLIAGCTTAKIPQSPPAAQNITANGKLLASLFQQRAAEYQALCFQAYNLAKIRLDQALLLTHNKPLAIVTDIDETVLDNSPYDVKQSLVGKDYEQKSWEEWTALAKADTVPGARSFLKYASSKGVKIYYLTNRAETERKGTLANLVQKDFPDAVNEQLILKGAVSSKEPRRQAIAEKYDIVMLIGDNLGDFSVLFDKKTSEERAKNTIASASEFGKRFIVLPNPVYGDWENSLYKYNYNFTPAQKDSVIKSVLKSY
ncbi:5'-nucleotidase, lipoprotein e(P4) family [Dyadobacter psychrotolerans]|uniref:5'-nucleotidase, lipoprotein e(P4) family n=1 Tax=Dyadobacter psychrotolerans TaxID=2541721 RepID=A0A4R5DTG0_9BACT|nr:5'-nucleotidase, lipoprotein e(P4) family [Dyadobacter psychrotolerans]TDE15381.1 5'-nucleotidase, lipoprotein e(P4) family [Dyadobacter psychrotolerans]